MEAMGSIGNEVGQRVGRYVLVLSYCVSTKFCIKWPLGCLPKPTYRANVVLFELELK